MNQAELNAIEHAIDNEDMAGLWEVLFLILDEIALQELMMNFDGYFGAKPRRMPLTTYRGRPIKEAVDE